MSVARLVASVRSFPVLTDWLPWMNRPEIVRSTAARSARATITSMRLKPRSNDLFISFLPLLGSREDGGNPAHGADRDRELMNHSGRDGPLDDDRRRVGADRAV